MGLGGSFGGIAALTVVLVVMGTIALATVQRARVFALPLAIRWFGQMVERGSVPTRVTLDVGARFRTHAVSLDAGALPMPAALCVGLLSALGTGQQTATYVLQGVYGLSPQGYSFAFGLNSLGFMGFGFAAGRLSGRWSEKGTLLIGLLMCVAGATGVLVTALVELSLPALVVSLFVLVSGAATTTPPATSLALANYPGIAGTASSLLGLAQFAFGGLAAPLVGLGGARTAVPLGVVTVAAAALAACVHAVTIRRHTRVPHRASAWGEPLERVTAPL